MPSAQHPPQLCRASSDWVCGATVVQSGAHHRSGCRGADERGDADGLSACCARLVVAGGGAVQAGGVVWAQAVWGGYHTLPTDTGLTCAGSRSSDAAGPRWSPALVGGACVWQTGTAAPARQLLDMWRRLERHQCPRGTGAGQTRAPCGATTIRGGGGGVRVVSAQPRAPHMAAPPADDCMCAHTHGRGQWHQCVLACVCGRSRWTMCYASWPSTQKLCCRATPA